MMISITSQLLVINITKSSLRIEIIPLQNSLHLIYFYENNQMIYIIN